MKKIVFPILLGALMLSSCVMYNGSKPDESSSTSAPTSSETRSTSTDTSSHIDPGPGGDITVYLVLTPVGRYAGTEGEDFSDIHITDAIKYTAKVGDALPGADKITVKSGTGKFLNWVYYDTATNPGAPTVVETIPAKNGMILYAQFGNYTIPYVPPKPGDICTFYFVNTHDWTDLKLYCWDNAGNKNAGWPGVEGLQEVDPSRKLYKFTATYGETNWVYPNFIINGSGGTVQTVDCSLEAMNNYNTVRIGDKSGEKYTVTYEANIVG